MKGIAPPPLPSIDAPFAKALENQNKRIGILYLIAALGQLALAFDRFEAYREVLAGKDWEHALHLAAFSLGISVVYWLVVMAIQIVLIAYCSLSALALIWIAMVYRSSRSAAQKRKSALLSCSALPCGLLVGIYAVQLQKNRKRADKMFE